MDTHINLFVNDKDPENKKYVLWLQGQSFTLNQEEVNKVTKMLSKHSLDQD